MRNRKMKAFYIFVGVFTTHWAAQFLAWSYAERSTLMCALWTTLASPLVHAAGPWENLYFWTVVTLNSALWAGAITYLAFRFARKDAS